MCATPGIEAERRIYVGSVKVPALVWIRDVNQLKSRLIEEWEQFQQSVINEAVKQWRQHLRACIRAR